MGEVRDATSMHVSFYVYATQRLLMNSESISMFDFFEEVHSIPPINKAFFKGKKLVVEKSGSPLARRPTNSKL